MIRLATPTIDEREIEAVGEVLRSGWLVQGARVAEFEHALALQCSAAHCVVYSSGTAALHGTMHALGIGPGDLVVVPAYSWPATANVVEVCGAQPIFVDIDERTLSMRPDRLKETLLRITSGAESSSRLRAVITVHPFGVIDTIDEIKAVCDEFGLPLIEDAACSIGTEYDGKASGAWSTVACLSFHPRKVVTTGEGGAVTTNDPALAAKLRSFRNHGLIAGAERPEFGSAGLNYRMTEFQAAMGVTQMAKLGEILRSRREQAAIYDGLLQEVGMSGQAFERNRCKPNFQSYIAMLPQPTDVVKVVAAMRDKGVECSIGTWNIPLTGHFAARYGYRRGDFPGTDRAFGTALALPLSQGMSQSEQQTVVSALAASL